MPTKKYSGAKSHQRNERHTFSYVFYGLAAFLGVNCLVNLLHYGANLWVLASGIVFTGIFAIGGYTFAHQDFANKLRAKTGVLVNKRFREHQRARNRGRRNQSYR